MTTTKPTSRRNLRRRRRKRMRRRETKIRTYVRTYVRTYQSRMIERSYGLCARVAGMGAATPGGHGRSITTYVRTIIVANNSPRCAAHTYVRGTYVCAAPPLDPSLGGFAPLYLCLSLKQRIATCAIARRARRASSKSSQALAGAPPPRPRGGAAARPHGRLKHGGLQGLTYVRTYVRDRTYVRK